MSATEAKNPLSEGFDIREPSEILAIVLDGQIEALSTVRTALPSIEKAARHLAETIRSGGRIAYAAAGSSALMAMADGLELPGTFGIPSDRIMMFVAGGVSTMTDMLGSTEDDDAQAATDISKAELGPGDCLIAVSASGSTPYTLAALEAALAAGASTIGVANNAGSPLLQKAGISILLPTPPEIVAGSTRLGAASAQKTALNMISTLMAVELGHIHDGRMINLRADNRKLQSRARRIVSEISGCDEADSARLLDEAGGSVKHAVLLASGIPDMTSASQLLTRCNGQLRHAIASIEKNNQF